MTMKMAEALFRRRADMAGQLASFRGELKRAADLIAFADGPQFHAFADRMCAAVSKAITSAKSGKDAAEGAAIALEFAEVLTTLCKRLVRLRGRGIAWEQGTVQAIVACALKVLQWPEVAVSAEGAVLGACALVIHDRNQMLGKDQDGLVMECLKRATVTRAPTNRPEDEIGDEDSRDSQLANCERKSTLAVSLPLENSSCLQALQCLHALAFKAKRKSHFIDAHLKSVATAMLSNVDLLIPAIVAGHRLSSLALTLHVLEALISAGGPSFASLFQQRVHWMVTNLSALLMSTALESSQMVRSGMAEIDDQDYGGFSSFTEGGTARYPMVDRLRVHTLLVLSALASNCFKQLSNDMLILLPFSTKSSQPLTSFVAEANSLYSLLLQHTNHRVRLHSILLLHALLKPSRAFFSSAADRQITKQQQSSFLTLSYKLALTLRDLHAAVESALGSEEESNNRIHLLRLVPILVGVTPYDRLETTSLLRPILNRLLRPSLAANVSCVLGLTRLRPAQEEILAWLAEANVPAALSAIIPGDVIAESCLVELCSRYRSTVDTLMISDQLISRLLTPCPSVSPEAVQSVIEYAASVSSEPELRQKCWDQILKTALMHEGYFLSDQSPSPLGAAYVTLLSNIPEASWSSPNRSGAQLVIMSAVAGAFDSGEPLLKVASLRGVGQLLILEQLVAENRRFLVDAQSMLSVAIRSSESSSEVVAISFWALGNFAHALATLLVDPMSEECEDLEEMLVSALAMCIKAFSEASAVEKVRCSCLRVIGKAAAALQPSVLAPFLAQCWDILCRSLGKKERPKIRWNACSAIANFSEPWPSRLLPLLLDILGHSANYKERISVTNLLKQCVECFRPDEKDSIALVMAHTSLSEYEAGASRSKQLEKAYAEQYAESLRSLVRKVARMDTKSQIESMCDAASLDEHARLEIFGNAFFRTEND